MQSHDQKTHLTPPQIAAMWGASVDSVLAFIHNKELKASNLGRATRPRWRIAKEDLQHFLDSRSNQTAPKPQMRRAIPKPNKEYV